MPRFGRTSLARLDTCDKRLQIICNEAIKIVDFSVICGHRIREVQNKAFREGTSKVEHPNSKHNKTPSQAIDIVPYPVPERWGEGKPKELARFYFLMGVIKVVAHHENIPIRLGGDWDGDGIFTDQTFDDLCHVEIL